MDEQHNFFDFHEELEEEPKKRPAWFKLVGVLVILGLLYVYGVQQALFYQRTPLGAHQAEVESIIGAETIVVPVKVFIFRNNDDAGSLRESEDIEQMVENASAIWSQADIELVLIELTEIRATDEEIEGFLRNPRPFLENFSGYDPNVINVFLSKSLIGTGGVNGLAFGGTRTTAVADLTTSYDFRVFAHEVGHVLGLGHVTNNQRRLMYTGAKGTSLTEEEVLQAREFALEFTPVES